MWTFLEQKSVKARKRHRCFCCNQQIEIGDQFIRRSGVENGEGFMHMRMHPECEEATRSWKNEDWEFFSAGTLIRGTGEER